MRKSILGLMVGIASIIGCTYDPDEEYFNNIQQPDPVITKISFFTISDTADFRGNVELTFLSGYQPDIVYHKLTLNEAVISEGQNALNSVAIYSPRYPDGVYELKFQIRKRVTSQSLASKLNQEFTEQEFTKKVVVYNQPIPKPELTTTVEKGILVLHWKPYSGRSFKSYRITGSGLTDPVVIENQNQTSLPIENFVGGTAYFSMQLKAYNESADLTSKFNHSVPVSIEKTPTGLHFEWGPNPFLNYDHTEIKIQNGQDVTSFNLSKGQQTFDHDFVWTFPHDVTAIVFGMTKENKGSYLKQEKFSTQIFFNFAGGSGIFKTSSDTLYSALYTIGWSDPVTYFTLFDIKSGNRVQSKSGKVSVSPNGQYAFELRDNYKLMKIDGNTLSYTDQFDVTSLIGTYKSFKGMMVSDQGIILIYVGNDSNENWYYKIDWRTKQLIYSGKTSFSSAIQANGRLSPDGKNVYMTDRITRVDVTPTTSVSLEPGYPYFDIGLHNREETIFWRLDYLIEKQVYSPYKAISIPYPKKIVSIFSSNENHFGVAFNNDGKLAIDIVELGTLKIVHTIETTFAVGTGINFQYYLVGNSFILGASTFSGNTSFHTETLNF